MKLTNKRHIIRSNKVARVHVVKAYGRLNFSSTHSYAQHLNCQPHCQEALSSWEEPQIRTEEEAGCVPGLFWNTEHTRSPAGVRTTISPLSNLLLILNMLRG